MNTYDICLHVGAGGRWLGNYYIDIKNHLEEKGLTVILYTSNKEVRDVFVSNSIPHIFLEEYKGIVDTDWALNFVKKLGFKNPKSLYISEQKFYDLEEDDCVKFFSALVHAVEGLKGSPRAKFYITYEGDEFDHNIFRVLTRMNQGKSIYWGYSNLDIRIHFHYDEKRYSRTPMEEIKQIPENELTWIQDYILNYTKKQTNLWGDPKKHDIHFKLFYLKSALNKILDKLSSREIDPRRKFEHSAFVYARRILRRQFAYTQYKNNFCFKDGEEYYYFPMHVPFDSQLTQRGLPFYDQVSLIETITQYIPYPGKLIVKEHPMGRGLYSIKDIRRLSKLKNVILLPAYANSHNIIPNVKAIFVINSSVGYEGLMYKKPVVTFGRSFYRKQGLTIDIDSLYDLENVFDKIESHQLSDQMVESFLFRVKKSTYAVDLYNFNEKNYKEKISEFAFAIEKEVLKVIGLGE